MSEKKATSDQKSAFFEKINDIKQFENEKFATEKKEVPERKELNFFNQPATE